MKNIVLLLLLILKAGSLLYGQNTIPDDRQRKAITSLIDQYSEAREKRDTVLLKTILTIDVDQLVSTGEWRNGIGASLEGMLKSSINSPGTRTLTIDKIRMLNPKSAIIDWIAPHDMPLVPTIMHNVKADHRFHHKATDALLCSMNHD